MRKIAVSLLKVQVDALDALRRKRNISLSRLIQEAVSLYLAEQEHSGMIRAYVDGYGKHPEGRESEGYARLAAEVLGAEDWE